MTVLPTRQLLGATTGGYARLARRVQSGELVRLRRGMVAENTVVTPSESLRRVIEASAPFLRRGTWFSHRSAALIHGLPVIVHGGELAEVVRTFGGHGNSSRLLRARAATMVPGEGTWVDGLPVTTLTRTVLDLVRTLPFTEAVMIADAALRLGVDRGELLAGVGEDAAAARPSACCCSPTRPARVRRSPSPVLGSPSQVSLPPRFKR